MWSLGVMRCGCGEARVRRRVGPAPRNTTARATFRGKGCLTKRVAERHGQSNACNAPRRSPRFSSDSTPPCASAIWRQSTSPIPVPDGFVV